MGRQANLISSPKERSSRRDAKRWTVLRFLRQHLWSSQDILQDAMGLESRQAAHKTLVRLESELLIRRHTFDALGGKITLWGITEHGQALAFDLVSEQPFSSYFEPSKVSEQNLRHELELQRLRLRAEACGWTDWIDGNRIGNINKNEKRPDAIATDTQGKRTAVECERTLKVTRRYSQHLASYLRSIKAGDIARVVWVAPSQELAARLQKIIFSIKTVRVAGQNVAIDPGRHHQHLHFTSYDRWPNA